VGSRQIQVHDEAQGVSFTTLVHYPTVVPSVPTPLGPYTLDVSPDAPLAQGRFPLVMISHGGGGWHVLYRSISTHLAQHGYIVGLVEHPGDNRNDNSKADTHDNLVNRPRHVRLAIDAVCADGAFGIAVLPDRIAMIGHSLGGYTALAVAGGVPWSKTGERVDVVPDPRIQALVLLAPATAFYRAPDALRRVTVPILMLIAEHDALTPRWHADVVLNGVPDPDRVAWRVIENAGHFSFLSPFPGYLKKARFPPANDPAGFDREAFHERLPGEVRRWLDDAWARAAEPPSSAASR
jgi:predicted dienelactone hydrolase